MKKWLVLLGMVVAISGCQKENVVSQNEEPSLPDTVEEPGGWQTDFEIASATAKAEGKHLLIDFSGSDWCGWCIKLEKEVFSKNAFKNYAKDHLVLVLADFPRNKSNQSEKLQKQNQALSEKYNVGGFPTVFILSPDGNLIAKTGYQAGGPEAYVDYIKNVISKAQK